METMKKENIWSQIGKALGVLFVDEKQDKESKEIEEAMQELQGYETLGKIEKLENMVDPKKDAKAGKGKSSFSETLKVETASKVKLNSAKTHENEGKTLGDE